MKLNKSLIYIAVAGMAMATTTSCDDFLDRNR